MQGANLQDILAGSEAIPHRLHANDGALEFVRLERADLRRLSFHDGRDFDQSCITRPFSLDQVEAAARAEKDVEPAVSFIFHSAFCCSTLLARCLDLEGRALSLREPNLLLDLANLKRFRHVLFTDTDQWKRICSLGLSMLARPARPSETVLIKPTNIVNNIIPELLAVAPTSRAILLYSDLRSFLISLIKKGEPGRAFGRQTFHILNMDCDFARDIAPDMLVRMTDLQVIVLVWRMQMTLFAEVLKSHPDDRVVSLDSKPFLEKPEAILSRAADFLGVDCTDEEIGKIVDGPLFSRHAKETERQFDAAGRSAENQRIEDEYGQLLDQLVAWEKTLKPQSALRWPLPNAL